MLEGGYGEGLEFVPGTVIRVWFREDPSERFALCGAFNG